MYSNLLFLILVLLTASFSLDNEEVNKQAVSQFSLFTALGGYILLLLLIISQNSLPLLRKLRGLNKHRLLLIAQLEMLAFFAILYFFIMPGNLFSSFIFPQFFQAAITLVFYFFALAVFYTSSPSQSHLKLFSHRFKAALLPVQFLFPFTIPFLLFSLLTDFYSALPIGLVHSLTGFDDDFLEILWVSMAVALFFLSMMLFLPGVIQRCWGCTNLPSSDLKTRLTEVCRKARFKCSGMKTWPVMKGLITAGIIGIYAPFRYVLFTDCLLQKLPPDEIEAVLCHEIGHSKYKHLLFFPILMLGMGAVSGLFSLFFGQALSNFFSLQHQLHPRMGWGYIELGFDFMIYTGIIILYFRLVFGLFSRNFERQADLYIFKLNLNPQSMINALDRIATLGGNIHDIPNWHHYGIRQRMNFIENAIHDPSLSKRHQQRVWKLAGTYIILLIGAIGLLLLPLAKAHSPFYSAGQKIISISGEIDSALNRSLREKIYSNSRIKQEIVL